MIIQASIVLFYLVNSILCYWLKVICDRLFDGTNLISIFTFESYDITSRHGHNPAPVWQNARNTSNDSFHLTSINELTVNAILQLFNDLVEIDDSRVLVHEKKTESFGNT